MPRFSFGHCAKCDRLNIHGATCVCGHRTHLAAPCTCPTDSEIDAAIEAATNHLLHRGTTR